MERRKRNISIRLSESDIKKTKEVSVRLGVKDSELFRFAIKNTLRKLTPLNEVDLKGADLIPAWLVWGEELSEYFDLSGDQLQEIFNSDAECGKGIDDEDIDLMLLSRLNGSYVVKRLSEKCGSQIDSSHASKALKQYLYDKYVLGTSCKCDALDERGTSSESPKLEPETTNLSFINYR